jgi:hypothetical protein
MPIIFFKINGIGPLLNWFFDKRLTFSMLPGF